MRRWGVLLVAVLGAVACIDHPDPPAIPTGPQLPTSPSAEPTDKPTQPGTDNKDAKSVLTEVVYVLMDAWDGGKWMCTGALVSADRVVTAAHCLNESMFERWEIVAPLAAKKPRVSASNPALFNDEYDDIANPDIGFLRLDEPINLPAYATLTNVTDRVEKGEKLTALAIVREKEDFEAPFKVVKDLAVSSTTKIGYSHGFSTPYFSHGGDSGAGLFLVENGQTTHKLIAVARQPEPDKKVDHFTRVDGDFLEWFQANK